ncbi:MAG: DNA-packaging protein [Caulobacteraceae bacterium]|nr:DNA-packaging protein [Caulobacteraceae bacterium]
MATECGTATSPTNSSNKLRPGLNRSFLRKQPWNVRAELDRTPRAQSSRLKTRAWEARHQRPPPGDWRTWLFLGGRGAGKTYAGAAWLLDQSEHGGRLALVGPTLHDVREVMIEGPSGLRALKGHRESFRYEKTRRRIVFESGAIGYCFSAEDPESLRGPQFAHAWADEFCAWPYPEETLAMLRFGLRLGDDPRLMVTTTPKPIPALKALRAEPGTIETRHATQVNAANLSPAFVQTLEGLYGGTRLAAQELEGLVVEDAAGALWRAADLSRARGAAPAAFERVVVGLDPPASAHGDACGVIVAGRAGGRGFVLADRSARGLSPLGWAQAAVAAAREFSADAIVAEANQGGEMVRSLLAMADPPCPIRLVHARLAKRARAEPVAALYEQGRVVHCGAFPALEEELMALGAGRTAHSPDRADALVWAIAELLLGDAAQPRLSVL